MSNPSAGNDRERAVLDHIAASYALSSELPLTLGIGAPLVRAAANVRWRLDEAQEFANDPALSNPVRAWFRNQVELLRGVESHLIAAIAVRADLERAIQARLPDVRV